MLGVAMMNVVVLKVVVPFQDLPVVLRPDHDRPQQHQLAAVPGQRQVLQEVPQKDGFCP